jgi:hypothetical protein
MPRPASQSNGSWLECLLPHMEFAAKPFRLMNLPVNLRARTWRFTIACQQEPVIYSITEDSPFGYEQIHHVTRVSHEIRSETLALAWANVRVEFMPPVHTLRLYKGEQFSSKYADRFHQLDAFEQSNNISRVVPLHAAFPIFEKGQPESDAYGSLMLDISRTSFNDVDVCCLWGLDYTARLDPSAMRKIESHFDLARRVFSSSRSSTAMVAMALLGAPSLWEKSNLECDISRYRPTNFLR